MARQDSDNTTHFGYQTVATEEKADLVRGVFDSVASRYDIMNDLMSGGLHRLWKRYTIDQAAVRPGDVILDLAGGTGDLARAFAKKVGPEGHVVLADINAAMLEQGRRRLVDAGVAGNVSISQFDSQNLAFDDRTFDCITMAFGLRNVTDKDAALREMFRVLKPGGRALILEFSEVQAEPLKKLYDAWSFGVLPVLGKYVARDENSYRYLAESIRKHPPQEELAAMMREAGFSDVSYRNLTGGIVAVHSGTRA